jgi:Protein of unknown function (DUF1302)
MQHPLPTVAPVSAARDLEIPEGVLWGAANLTEEVAVEAFYRYDWQRVRSLPVGSYFSDSDPIGSDGLNAAMLGSGRFSDLGTDLDAALPAAGALDRRSIPGGRPRTQLVLPMLDARRVHRRQDVADAAVLAGAGLPAHQHEDHVRRVGRAGPDLLTVDDEVVAVTITLRAGRRSRGSRPARSPRPARLRSGFRWARSARPRGIAGSLARTSRIPGEAGGDADWMAVRGIPVRTHLCENWDTATHWGRVPRSRYEGHLATSSGDGMLVA